MFWEQFLASHTTHDNTDTQSTSVVPLRDYSLILVQGPDANTFLQGQCTCDFAPLNQGQIITGAHCTPKGRMNSSFIGATLDADTIALRVHTSIAESALAALKKYAVFSKVTLSIADDYFAIGLINFTEPLETAPEVGQFLYKNKVLTLRHDEDLYEIWFTAEQATETLKTFASLPLQKTANLWQLKNIQRGIGEIRSELVEKLLPQEINLQLTGGVSFKKGCYTGQEIVARIHYRGQMKKHMYRGRVTSDTPPTSAEPIYVNDKAKGTLINAALCHSESESSQEYEFLALCDDATVNNDSNTEPSKIDPNSPANIQWQALPYAIS